MILNALNELVCTLGSTSCYKVDDIKWAVIKYAPDDTCETKFIVLKENYSNQELKEFLNKLNFEYNDYGGQDLYGCVFLNDNTWLERDEYDGEECWLHRCEPKFDFLFKKFKDFGE